MKFFDFGKSLYHFGKDNRKAVGLTLLCIGMAAFIFSNSLQNGEESGNRSEWVAGILQGFFAWMGVDQAMGEHLLRKTAHFLEYFAMGVLLELTAQSYPGRAAVKAVVPYAAGLAVAACDESIQRFVPGRSGQVSDVILDFCGVISGVMICRLIRILMGRRRHRKV